MTFNRTFACLSVLFLLSVASSAHAQERSPAGPDSGAFHHGDTSDWAVDKGPLYATGVHIRYLGGHDHFDYPGRRGGLATFWRDAPGGEPNVPLIVNFYKTGLEVLDTTAQAGGENPLRRAYLGYAYNDVPCGYGNVMEYDSARVFLYAGPNAAPGKTLLLMAGGGACTWADTTRIDSNRLYTNGDVITRHVYKGANSSADSELVTRRELVAMMDRNASTFGDRTIGASASNYGCSVYSGSTVAAGPSFGPWTGNPVEEWDLGDMHATALRDTIIVRVAGHYLVRCQLTSDTGAVSGGLEARVSAGRLPDWRIAGPNDAVTGLSQVSGTREFDLTANDKIAVAVRANGPTPRRLLPGAGFSYLQVSRLW